MASLRVAIRRPLRGISETHFDRLPPYLHFAPDFLFVLFLVAIAISRWIALDRYSAPSGIDPGNWLAFGHAIVGRSVRSGSIQYPPIIPLLTDLSAIPGNHLWGIRLLGVLTSLAPAGGVYIVFRQTGLGLAGAACAALLAVAGSTGEALAWGGYPQLLGLGVIVVALWLLDREIREPSVRIALLSGALFAGALATSDLVGIASVAAGIVLLILHVVFRPIERERLRRLVTSLPLVAAPCLPLIPLYLHMASSVVGSASSKPSYTRLDASNFVPAVASLVREFPAFWRVIFLLGLSMPIILIAQRRTALWITCTALILATALLLLWSRESRFLYLFPLVAVLSLGAYLDFFISADLPVGRWFGFAGLGLVVVCLGVQTTDGLRFFATSQVPYYEILKPGLLQAVLFIHNDTGQNAVIAVSPSRDDYPFGWWVEGLGERSAIYGSSLRWLTYSDERTRAEKAARVFSGGGSIRDAAVRARCAGADYLLVEKDWRPYSDWVAHSPSTPISGVLLENDAALLMRTVTSDCAAQPSG